MCVRVEAGFFVSSTCAWAPISQHSMATPQTEKIDAVAHCRHLIYGCSFSFSWGICSKTCPSCRAVKTSGDLGAHLLQIKNQLSQKLSLLIASSDRILVFHQVHQAPSFAICVAPTSPAALLIGGVLIFRSRRFPARDPRDALGSSIFCSSDIVSIRDGLRLWPGPPVIDHFAPGRRS